MCGRYVLYGNPSRHSAYFGTDVWPDFPDRFNISPSSWVPIIRQAPTGERVASLLKWGLVPHWAKDPTIGNKLNNARAESVAEKPSFRDAFQRRRCLIPAMGFYEWKAEGKSKQPYYISGKEGQPLAMGGLWESWRDPQGEVVRTFCVITTSPNSIMEPIHDRMPVLIHPGNFAVWLDPSIPGRELASLLEPVSGEKIQAWPVSKAVSKAAEDKPESIEPVESN